MSAPSPSTASSTGGDLFEMAVQAGEQKATSDSKKTPKKHPIKSAFSALYNYKVSLTILGVTAFLASPYGAAYRPVITDLFWSAFMGVKNYVSPPPPPPSGWSLF